MNISADSTTFLSSEHCSDSWYGWMIQPYKKGWTTLKKAFGPVNELRAVSLANPSRSETKGAKLSDLAHRIKFIGLAIPLLLPVINIFPLAYIVNQIYIHFFFNEAGKKNKEKKQENFDTPIDQNSLLNINSEIEKVNPTDTLKTEVPPIKNEVSEGFPNPSLPDQTLLEEESPQNPTNGVLIISCESTGIAEEKKKKREVAATKIQRLFRRRSKKMYKPNLDLLRNPPPERFIPGEHAIETKVTGFWLLHPTEPPKSEISIPFIERTVRRLLVYNRKDEVLRLANILFATPHKGNARAHTDRDFMNLRKLTKNNFPCEPEQIVQTFMKAVHAWRTNGEYRPPYVNKSHFKHRSYNRVKKEFKAHNPEELISISHGGGYTNIKEFLSGKNKGYGLEDGEVGIQVSLNYNGRDKDYSQNSKNYFDTPAILTGKIARKYLNVAPNYPGEAGIVQENAQYLTDIQITCVEKPYWEDPDLYKTIDHLINEVPAPNL